tara:strand:+ start:73938 stop:74477 length:540 start_codon:yes stop_codon:yes gene_type:complete
MKNLQVLLCTILLSTTLSVNSQNTKGDIHASILASPLTTVGNDDLGLIGLFGAEFFVFDQASVSANFITSNNSLFKSDSETTIRSYSMMPSFQYYFINNPKFHWYGQLGYGYGFEDQTQGIAENSALTIFSIGAGLNIKMLEKLSLKVLVPYFDANNITFGADSADGIGVFIGFNYKLR